MSIINVYEGVMACENRSFNHCAAQAASRRWMLFMTEHTASVGDHGFGTHRRLIVLHIHYGTLHFGRGHTTPLRDTKRDRTLAGTSHPVLTADRLPPAPPLSVPAPPEAAAVGPALGPSRLGPLSWDPAVLALLAGGSPLQLPPFLQALTQPPAPPQSLPDTVPLTVSVPLRPYEPGMGMPSAPPAHLRAAEDGPRQPADADRLDVKPDPAPGFSTGFHGAEQPRYPSPSSATGSAASPAPPAVPNLAAPKPSNKASYLEKNRMAQVRCCHIIHGHCAPLNSHALADLCPLPLNLRRAAMTMFRCRHRAGSRV